MSTGSVGRRYAKALYDLAAAEGIVDETVSSLAELSEAVVALGDGALGPGLLEGSQRHKLGNALAEPFGTDSTLGRFIRLLADRDRLDVLPSIHDWFVRIQDRADGRVRLTISAAAELESADVDAIVTAFKRIAGDNITAQVEIDPSLLGGAVVELEGRVYDGSIKTRLARLAARMSGDA